MKRKKTLTISLQASPDETVADAAESFLRLAKRFGINVKMNRIHNRSAKKSTDPKPKREPNL